MEKVNVLLVEDDKLIAATIRAMIDRMGYQCIGTASGAAEALELAASSKPDIALLDIRLRGEKTGIWLADQLKRQQDIPYIFMTSFSDRKTIEQAASTLPYGYLVKPVEYQNVHAAIATALTRFEIEKKKAQAGESPGKELESDVEYKPSLRIKDVLFVKDEYQYVKVTVSDIDFVKSSGNYVEIHSGEKKKVIKETLKNMEAKLDESLFFQVHRSYLINLSKIERIGGNYLVIGKSEVPLSKEKKDELLTILNAIN